MGVWLGDGGAVERLAEDRVFRRTRAVDNASGRVGELLKKRSCCRVDVDGDIDIEGESDIEELGKTSSPTTRS